MRTEEKMVSFPTDTGQSLVDFDGKVNEYLRKGWKVKPATTHDITAKLSKRTCVVLYREVPNPHSPYSKL